MPFEQYYEKVQSLITHVGSLEQLIRWRRRTNISNSGLSYKTQNGYLQPHQYHGPEKKRLPPS